MPTYSVGTGKTYATIQDALNAIPSNITGTGEHRIEVDAGAYTTSSLVLPVKTGTSSANYIHLTCASGSEHNGSPSSGVRVTCTTHNVGGVIQVGPGHKVSNIVVISNSTGLEPYCLGQIVAGNTSTLRSRVENVIGLQLLSKNYAFNLGNIYAFDLYKCIAITPSSSNSGAGFSTQGDAFTRHSIVNCGSYNFRTSFFSNGDAFINCWGRKRVGSTGTDFSGSFDSSSSNNASSDSTAPGSNSKTNVTDVQFAFVGAGANNFHITRISMLYAAGINVSSRFSTDIDNETINSIWSIGPDFPSSSFCSTDLWEYAIGAGNGSGTFSHPWYYSQGDPFTTGVGFGFTGSHLNLTFDDVVFRDPIGSTGGWGASFDIRLAITSPHAVAFGVQYGASTTAFMPGFQNSSGVLTAVGFRYSNSFGNFGSFQGQSLGAFGSSTLMNVKLAYKSVGSSLACSITKDGVTYKSDFVVISGSNFNPYQLVFYTRGFISDPRPSEWVGIYDITWRNALSDSEVDGFYNGVALCGSISTTPTTSSSPWQDKSKKSRTSVKSNQPSIKTSQSDTSIGFNDNTRQTEAKEPSLRLANASSSKGVNSKPIDSEQSSYSQTSSKGFKNGYIAAIPNLSAYSSVVAYGVGQRLKFYSDDLEIGKEYAEFFHIGIPRTHSNRASLYANPKGGFRFVPTSNDCITTFMSHFQLRHGSNLSGGTTYYEFTPSKRSITADGSSFGTGTYGASGGNLFSLNVTKLVNGTGYQFDNGVCDKLGFRFDRNGFALEPSFYFKSARLLGSTLLGSAGTYSSLPHFSPFACSWSMLGASIETISFQGDNALKSYHVAGGTTPYFGFGKYQLKGEATIDKSKVSLAYIGSMLGTVSFSIVGTLYNDERDKMVIQMQNCLLDDFDIDVNASTLKLPFRVYESEDDTTPPIKIMVWTRNYSGTSFQPN